MIKKYKKFIKESAEFEERLNNNEESLEKEPLEEEEKDSADIFSKKLEKLADMLDVEVTDGKILYNGKKIIFPSETEMFHVGKKKFETAEEVYQFLKK